MDDILARATELERALAASARRFVAVQDARDPTSGARVATLAGDHVVVDGGRYAGSNISRLYGLGLFGSVTGALLSDVRAFYASSRYSPRAFVYAPVADRVEKALGDAGFTALRTDVVLWRGIDTPGVDADAQELRCDDVAAWTRALAPAFGAEDEPEATLLHRHAPFVVAPNAIFAVRDDGAITAGGALALEGEVAYFLADGTRPEARGRGHQRALIDARLRAAGAAGARVAFAITSEGVVSERNYLRAGFARLCTAEILTCAPVGAGPSTT